MEYLAIKKYFGRVTTIIMVFLLTFQVGASLISASPVNASDWSGWSDISDIYYDSTQEDENNPYLEGGARELETYLEEMSGDEWYVVTNSPPETPAIYLAVNPSMLSNYSSEAFRLQVNDDGITITGKTPFATRSGCYKLLDMLGVKWLSKSDIWTVVPDSLAELKDMDIIEEPDYIWREVAFGPTPVYGWDLDQIWMARNLCGGASAFRLSHSYYRFMPPEDWWNHPDSYLTYRTTLSENIDSSTTTIPVEDASGWPTQDSDTPNPELLIDEEIIRYTTKTTTPGSEAFLECTRGYAGTTPASHSINASVLQIPLNQNRWQVKPDDEYVISQAIAHAESRETEYRILYSGDKTPYVVISITPNDGQDWCDYRGKTTQELTNLVYRLTDDVADALYETRPDMYIGVYNYSLYADIPTFNFSHENVYVEMATAYDYTTLTDYQRISGLQSRGANVGIREYFDLYMWYKDIPPYWGRTKLQRIREYAEAGATVYRSESTHCWGPCAIIYWIAARLCWDSSQDIDDLIDEYCTYAFNDAKEPMINYYKLLMGGQHLTDNFLGAAIGYLDEAMTLAGEDEDVLKRIRCQIYYIYWEWKYLMAYGAIIAAKDLDAFQELYTWVSHLRDLYILSYNYVVDENAFHDPLRDTWDMTEEEIQDWFDTYADYTPPSPEDAETWLDELKTEYSGTYYDAEYTNPYDLSLSALGDVSHTAFSGAEAMGVEVAIPAASGETIKCAFKTFSPSSDTTFTLYTSDGGYVDSVTIPSTTTWIEHNFTASAGTGIYRLSGSGSINVIDHQASIVSTNSNRIKDCNLYFYVPSGTPVFLFEFKSGTVGATIYDPSGNSAGSIGAVNSGYKILGVNNPTPGIWRLEWDNNPSTTGMFQLFGVPDLLWHDPRYLAIEAIDYPVPPALDPIGNKSTRTNLLLQFTISATDPNGGTLTYSASNLPPWATFNPTTRTFSGTPSQVGTYTNVYFEVSDGALTDGEYITITVKPPGGSADINRDGIVNILDVISVVQQWGKSGSDGWIAQDANSDGEINILDIIFISQHLTL